jgi:myosin V
VLLLSVLVGTNEQENLSDGSHLIETQAAVGGTDFKLAMPKGAVESEDMKPRNPPSESTNDNLIDLQFLNEPEIVSALKKRYERNVIYTMTGPILIACNPFQVIKPDKCCDLIIEKFVTDIRQSVLDAQSGVGLHSHTHGSPDPSPEKLLTGRAGAGKSFYGAAGMKAQTNHSILISGESGSGKTEATKMLLR